MFLINQVRGMSDPCHSPREEAAVGVVPDGYTAENRKWYELEKGPILKARTRFTRCGVEGFPRESPQAMKDPNM